MSVLAVSSFRVAALAALLLASASSGAEAQSLIGRWSADQACSAQAPRFVFRGNTMEVWNQNQRLFSGNVRFASTGTQTAVTVLSVGRDTVQDSGNPEVGDIATFRRDGNRMFPVSMVRNGQRRAVGSDAQPFYLCR